MGIDADRKEKGRTISCCRRASRRLITSAFLHGAQRRRAHGQQHKEDALSPARLEAGNHTPGAPDTDGTVGFADGNGDRLGIGGDARSGGVARAEA